jgi:ABC-type amino acid transport system permease subunit
MLSGDNLWLGVTGTIVLWAISGGLAILIAFILAAGSVSPRRFTRILARSAVNVTRGVPTSLFVIATGIATMHLVVMVDLPIIFPGTTPAFQHLAWAIAFALALGSAGHLAEIFIAARSALGQARLTQARVLGLSRLRHAEVIARECAAIALPPVGTRLIHHLHNTAFASLFPVADLFGAIEGEASTTFRIFHAALLGCGIYVLLSGLTWLAFRWLEAAFAPPVAERVNTSLPA